MRIPKILINVMDYITNATEPSSDQKLRPTNRRDRLAQNGGKVSNSTVSQLATIMHIYLTNSSVSKHVLEEFAFWSRISILSIILQ